MQTAEERLRFAIRFAQTDLNKLRPGDWLNLKDDLADFLFPTGDISDIHGIPHHDPRELAAAHIQALQPDVKEILAIATSVAQRTAEQASEPERVPLLAFVDIQVQVKPVFAMFPTDPSRLAIHFNGPTRDAILMQLIVSLAQLPLDVLRCCPQCGTIFFRVRKQQYCSRQCVHRANVRQWRQTEGGKKYERARSHNRYKTRVQRRLGANVSVGRRPRSGGQQKES